jgi:hypothetical protein
MLITFERDRGRCHHVGRVSRDVESVGSTADSEPIEAEEVVDGLPVLAEVRPIERVSPVALPAVQAAAAAATGFVAGAATLVLVRRHSARKLARVSARRNAGGLPIVGTRSFLVDVHLIAKPSD